MNNDIIPPKKPINHDQPAPQSVPSENQQAAYFQEFDRQDESVPPTENPQIEQPSQQKKPTRRKKILTILVSLLGLVLVLVFGAFIWYQQALRPVSDNTNTARISLAIESGTTPSQIGDILIQKNLIRSKIAFSIYTRLSGTQNSLQAGSYRLSPAESTQTIVKHLTSGKLDEFSLTFYPGATLTDTTDGAENKKVDVTSVLKRAGYSSQEIEVALKKTYDHPLFVDKPAGTDLEGYVFGETYNFATSASVEDILMRTFDEFYSQIQSHNLVAQLKKQDLDLYQGITLASIVQREVRAPVGEVEPSTDQKQVAQVFLKRYRENMALGSDVTYHYAADKKGVPRDNTLQDPYNTRINVGLPPGPIGAPGLSSLLATANPASGDFVYFLSGDDDVTYFARTNEEHEQNIRDHCAYKCSLP